MSGKAVPIYDCVFDIGLHFRYQLEDAVCRYSEVFSGLPNARPTRYRKCNRMTDLLLRYPLCFRDRMCTLISYYELMVRAHALLLGTLLHP